MNINIMACNFYSNRGVIRSSCCRTSNACCGLKTVIWIWKGLKCFLFPGDWNGILKDSLVPELSKHLSALEIFLPGTKWEVNYSFWESISESEVILVSYPERAFVWWLKLVRVLYLTIETSLTGIVFYCMLCTEFWFLWLQFYLLVTTGKSKGYFLRLRKSLGGTSAVSQLANPLPTGESISHGCWFRS